MDLLNLRLAAARRRLLYRPDPKLIAVSMISPVEE